MTDAAQNSKQVLAQKGTAATPSFSFLGGNATGMYSAGTNQLGFSTAGVNAVTIDASQNVTVTGSFITPTIAGGTTASSTLTLESTTGAGTSDSILFKTGSQSTRMTIDTSGNVDVATGNLTFSGTGQRITGDFSNATVANRVFFETSTANASTTFPIKPNGTGTNANFGAYSNNLTTGSVLFMGVTNGATEARLNSAIVGSGTYLPMTFYTGGSEQMRIGATAGTDLGTVGIGYSTLTGVGVNGLAVAGNVGIGTSSPGAKLQVNGSTVSSNYYFGTATSSAGTVASDTGAAGAKIVFYGTTSGGGGTLDLWSGGTAPIQFNTGGSLKMLIDTSGNVGIGTSSPGAKLQIEQNQAAYTYCDLVNTTNGGGAIFRQIVRNIANTSTTSVDYAKLIGSGLAINNNDTNAANFTSFGVGSSERMRIDSSGNVGIGTTSTSGVKFQAIASNGWAATFYTNSGGASNTGLNAYGLTIGGNYSNGSSEVNIIYGSSGAGLDFSSYNGSTVTRRMTIDSNGNIIAGASAALATTATNGFLYVPTCAGTPTGTPTAVTGMAPIVVNTTNNKLYFYSGGAWRDAGP